MLQLLLLFRAWSVGISPAQVSVVDLAVAVLPPTKKAAGKIIICTDVDTVSRSKLDEKNTSCCSPVEERLEHGSAVLHRRVWLVGAGEPGVKVDRVGLVEVPAYYTWGCKVQLAHLRMPTLKPYLPAGARWRRSRP